MTTANHPHRLEDCPSIIINNPGKWKLFMHSKAGERTGIFIENLSIVLDFGLSTYKKIKAGFMTHKHCDHSLNLITTFTGRSAPISGQEELLGRPIYMPPHTKDIIYDYLKIIAMLSDDTYDTTCYSKSLSNEELCSRQGIHPIEVDYEDIFIIPGISNISVEVLKAYHTCHCNGYGFSSIKTKMKPEYEELKKTKEGQQQLRKLAEQNVQIREKTYTPELVFYCDSTSLNLSVHSEWKKYPVVICECTGIDPDSDAQKYELIGHTGFDKLLPILLENKDKQFILIHTSMKYNNAQLKQFENTINERHGLNIIVWSDEFVQK